MKPLAGGHIAKEHQITALQPVCEGSLQVPFSEGHTLPTVSSPTWERALLSHRVWMHTIACTSVHGSLIASSNERSPGSLE